MNPKERRANPEIPLLTEGITEEVFSNLLRNRQNFLETAFQNLERENPDLERYIIRECMVSSKRDVVLDWMLSYYEIFSRSAKRLNYPMVRISETTIKSTFGEEVAKLERDKSEQDLEMLFKEKEIVFEKIIRKQTNSSQELSEYWFAFVQFRNSLLLHEGYNPNVINSMLNSIEDMSFIFDRQLEADKLSKKFKL